MMYYYYANPPPPPEKAPIPPRDPQSPPSLNESLARLFAHCVKSKQNSSQKSIARHDISNCNNLCFCEKKNIVKSFRVARAIAKKNRNKNQTKKEKKKLMLLVRSKIQIKIITTTTTKQKKHLMKMPNYLWYTILVFSLKYVSLLVVWKRLWLWRNTTASLRCKLHKTTTTYYC